MPNRKPTTPKERHITVKPVRHKNPDTKALAKAMISWALKEGRSGKELDQIQDLEHKYR